ncbi:MAG: hypothetical protein JHC33_10620 [Ignisphaera sp.]|nr:hypothetical protein [Ignisphaera sp.]
MAIITKNSNTGGAIPTASQLQVGELAVNTADGVIYVKHTDNTIKSVSGATGGAGNPFTYLNDQVVTQNYTIPSGKNAMSAGPVSIADGVTVTIPDGSVWTIV